MTPATRTPLHIPPCHQGHAYVSFGGVQGWDDSDWVPADYNIYLEASATLPGNTSCLSDGSGCSVSESAEVDCTMAGLFYSAGASGFLRLGESYTWFQWSSGTTYNQMQPCPEPGQTVTCTADHLLLGSFSGLYVEHLIRSVRFLGLTVCSPIGKVIAQQNTSPERPYCYDLP